MHFETKIRNHQTDTFAENTSKVNQRFKRQSNQIKRFGNTTAAFVTEEGNRSVTKTFDLSLIDLASVFGKVIMTLPSHSGLYCIIKLPFTAITTGSLSLYYYSISLHFVVPYSDMFSFFVYPAQK